MDDKLKVESKEISDLSNPNANEDTSSDNLKEQPVDTKPSLAIPDRPPKNTVTRKKLAALLASLLLMVGLGFALWTKVNSDQVVQNEPNISVETKLGATIAITEGSVQYSSNATEWRDAGGGESVAVGDYIRTLSDSRAVILLDDGSAVRLDSETQIHLSELEPTNFEVTLNEGQVYSRVIESEDRRFAVLTEREQFIAQGTAYKTSTDENKDTLEVYQSSVKAASTEEEVEEGNMYDTESKKKQSLEIDKLEKDEFVQWNKQKDSADENFKDKLGVLNVKKEEKKETKKESPATETTNVGIELSAKAYDKGIKLSWTLSGVSAPNGFKIVRDKSDSTPSYKQHQTHYISGPNSTEYYWGDTDGATHFYRVCIYRAEGSCDTYSNSVSVKSPLVEKEKVKSGDISLSIDSEKISWTLSGGNAPHGFKVVVSQSENPKYPDNSKHYASKDTSSIKISKLGLKDGDYIRICKYTDGTQTDGCVDYSNQVQYKP